LASATLLSACAGAPAAPTAAPAKPAEPAKPTEAPKAAEAPKPTVAAAPAAGKATATIRYHSRAGQETDMMAERLPEFTKTSGVEVKAEPFPSGDYYQKLQTLAAGDQLGETFWCNLGIGWPTWGASGLMRQIDDLVKKDNLDLTVYYKSAVDQGILQGKMYGLPYKVQPGQMGIYYNVDQFKSAGVEEPDTNLTFDGLVDIAKALTKRSGNQVSQYGFVPTFGAGNDLNGGWWLTVHYARAWGANVVDEEGKKALVTDDKFKASVKWLHDLVFVHKAAPSYSDIPANNPEGLLLAGTGTMYQSGTWAQSLPARLKDAFALKNTLMPKGPAGKRGSMACADFIGINAKTKLVDEGWQLCKFLTDKESGVRLGLGVGGASGTNGARPDATKDERLMKLPLHPVWVEAIESAEPGRWPANLRLAEFNQALWQKMIGLWTGDEPFADKFFADLNSSLQQVLDLPKV
jgi:multiple sugar transport system substrate-binding protein